MSGKFLVIVAVVLGAIVVLLINNTIDQYEAKANPPTQTFYRATADITPGVTVADAFSDARHLLVEDKSLPESFARSYPFAVGPDQFRFIGRSAIVRPLKAGEWLEQKHLEPVSAEELRSEIPKGESLVSLTVTAESSVGYLVAPGDIVDLVITTSHTDPKAAGGVTIEAKPILTDVKVFAIDNLIGRKDGVAVKPRGTSYATVTLSAPQEDVLKVIAAKQTGKISLVLKSKKQD